MRPVFLIVFEQRAPPDNRHNTRLGVRSRLRQVVADRVTKLRVKLAKGTHYCGFATNDRAGKVLVLQWDDEIKLI